MIGCYIERTQDWEKLNSGDGLEFRIELDD